jgi:hypothetical protein
MSEAVRIRDYSGNELGRQAMRGQNLKVMPP